MISHGLLGAVRHAHSAVLASSDPPENAGTTTLLGGGVFKMENGEPDEWTLVLVSIGDVKCYVIHDGKVREPTMGNRGEKNEYFYFFVFVLNPFFLFQEMSTMRLILVVELDLRLDCCLTRET